MPDCPGSSIAADALDRLVLDVIELERLAGAIISTIEEIDPGVCPNPPVAIQLLELLYRAQEAGVTIDMAAGRRVSTLIATLAEEQSVKTAADRCRRCTALVSVRTLHFRIFAFAQSESGVWLGRITIRDEDDATVADARGGAGLCRAWDRRPADAHR